MADLTKAQRAELKALMETNDALDGPSFIARFHWHEGYASLVRQGLVDWGDPPPGFDKRTFAGTTITPKGRKALENGDG